MEWEFSASTSRFTGPVNEAARALGVMRNELARAGAATGTVEQAMGRAATATEKSASKGGALTKAFAGAKGEAGKLTALLKTGVVAGIAAIGAAAGATTILDLAKVAIGYRAVAQLQAIGLRTQLGFRQLFRGVDAGPLIRAAERFSRNLTDQTTTGRALGGVLTSAFNGVFSVIEKIEPIGTAAFQGLIIGAKLVQLALLRARVAIAENVGDIGKLVDVGKVATAVGYGMAAAVVTGAAAVALLAAPFAAAGVGAYALYRAGQRVYAFFQEFAASPLYAAIGNAVSSAFDIAGAAVDAVVGKIKAAVSAVGAAVSTLGDLPIIGDVAKAIGSAAGSVGDAIGAASGKAATAAANLAKSADAAVGAAVGDFVTSGGSLGDGVVSGLDEKNGALYEAGKRAAKAAMQGVKDEAEIKSPSRKMRREGGRQMGQGVALGMEDEAPRIQKAAATSLVPDPAKLPTFAGRGSSGVGSPIIGPLVLIQSLVVHGGEEMREQIMDALDAVAARTGEMLGMTVPARS